MRVQVLNITFDNTIIYISYVIIYYVTFIRAIWCSEYVALCININTFVTSKLRVSSSEGIILLLIPCNKYKIGRYSACRSLQDSRKNRHETNVSVTCFASLHGLSESTTMEVKWCPFACSAPCPFERCCRPRQKERENLPSSPAKNSDT